LNANSDTPSDFQDLEQELAARVLFEYQPMTIVDEQAWNVEPPPSSLSPQGLNGIYASRATCGDIRSNPRDQ